MPNPFSTAGSMTFGPTRNTIQTGRTKEGDFREKDGSQGQNVPEGKTGPGSGKAVRLADEPGYQGPGIRKDLCPQ